MEAFFYWDRDGEPIGDVLDWAKLTEDWDYKLVASEEVGPWTVRTIWSGVDWSFGDSERPLIFSTGVWRTAGEINVTEERHWATEAEAIAGHAEVVAARR